MADAVQRDHEQVPAYWPQKSPPCVHHIHHIVKIVRKANQIVSIIRITYEDRSDNTRVYSRRLRSDLIEVYKIMHNFEGLNREDFFFLLRSAPKMNHQYVSQSSTIDRLNTRKCFFSQKVVGQWNRLPTATVYADTINRFKTQTDPMLRQHGALYKPT